MNLSFLDQLIVVLYLAVIMAIGFAMKRRAARGMAAYFLMQTELLLISRDQQAIARYLPKLERCANFIESRRDPSNNLLLAGPAGNLLAPSYAGWKRSPSA